MQSYGNPPAGLMQDMAPGMDLGEGGLPGLPADMPECKTM
jgi:hypothetical protein